MRHESRITEEFADLRHQPRRPISAMTAHRLSLLKHSTCHDCPEPARMLAGDVYLCAACADIRRTRKRARHMLGDWSV
jgi:hypothetical protein